MTLEPLPSSPPNTGTPAQRGSAEPSPARADQRAAPVPGQPRRPGPIPLGRLIGLVAAAVAGLLLAIAWAGTGYRYEAYAERPAPLPGGEPSTERELEQQGVRLRTRERQLLGRLKAVAPRGVYIVIDQTHNRLSLKRDDDTLLEAICSAGSGMVLNETSGKKRQWVFDTPRGSFEVLSRTENPVWRKPDWAFVEEGQPIPKNPGDRLDYGSLGEYALYFGNGFMIHGTLYERLLGRAVSHGCIRVGRDDLRKVWAAAKLGTHIYIY
jgi:L,D-transpeptidase ErfK/SrfK